MGDGMDGGYSLNFEAWRDIPLPFRSKKKPRPRIPSGIVVVDARVDVCCVHQPMHMCEKSAGVMLGAGNESVDKATLQNNLGLHS